MTIWTTSPYLDILFTRLTCLSSQLFSKSRPFPFQSVFFASCWSEDVMVSQRCAFPYFDFLFPCFSCHHICFPFSSVFSSSLSFLPPRRIFHTSKEKTEGSIKGTWTTFPYQDILFARLPSHYNHFTILQEHSLPLYFVSVFPAGQKTLGGWQENLRRIWLPWLSGGTIILIPLWLSVITQLPALPSATTIHGVIFLSCLAGRTSILILIPRCTPLITQLAVFWFSHTNTWIPFPYLYFLVLILISLCLSLLWFTYQHYV